MATAGVSHDITIASTDGTTKRGYMLWRSKNGRRNYSMQSFRTIAERQIQGEVTHASYDPTVEMVWHQEDWRVGIGGQTYREHPRQLATAVKINSSEEGKLKLAYDLQTTTVTSNPNTYNPTGFAIVGSEVWAFIGRDVYSWDYTNKRWTIGTEPFAVTSIYRNGVIYKEATYVPRWTDDAGSSGSYTASDVPSSYIHKKDADADWTKVDGARSTNPDAFAYFTEADDKLWGGNIVDATDSTVNSAGRVVFDAASSGTGSATTSITLSHTTGAITDRVLMVGVSASGASGANRIPSGVTYNSVDMTKVGDATNSTTSASLWRLINPATGANNVVVTFGSATTNCVVGAVTFRNAHQTTVVGTAATATGTGTATSVDVATTKGGMVIDCVAAIGGVSSTPGANQTERYDAITTSGANEMVGTGTTEEATSTTITMSETLNSSAAWAMVGVEIISDTTATDTTIITSSSPESSLSAGDVIRIDSELMLVLGADNSGPSIGVIRGYRGTIATVTYANRDIYTMTHNKHHIRYSTADPTSPSDWGGGITIGDGAFPITALVGDGHTLIVCKTNGVWGYYPDGTTQNLTPEFAAMAHPDNFKGAFNWNGRIILPVGTGGMRELVGGVIRDISLKNYMPEETEFHGRVVAVDGDPDTLFILVHEAGSTKYHLLMALYQEFQGRQDYRWHHIGAVSYTTATDEDHAVLFSEGVPSGTSAHHRIWVGIESTGSNVLPSFYPLAYPDDAELRFADGSDQEAETVDWDANLPEVESLFSKLEVNSKNCGSEGSHHYIEVKISIDGASYDWITGAQGSSKITTDNQTFVLPDEKTGKRIRLKFLFERGTTTTVSPELRDFTLFAHLRPDAVNVLPLDVLLDDDMMLGSGALSSSQKGDLSQIRTWADQSAEVTVVDPEQTSRDYVFMRQTLTVDEVSKEPGRRPAFRVRVNLIQVPES